MVKTSTKRSREFRKKRKLNPELHAEDKAKERLRWQQRKATRKQNQICAETKKEKERKRKAAWRKRKMMASMKQNQGEHVSQNISLRMGSMEQTHEEPVSQNISEDSHDNCIQEDEDYWKQDEAGPSNVKPLYTLKKSKMLVNVAFFVKSLQSLNNHGGDGCNFADMYITGETTIDCNVGIELSCTVCLTTAFVWTDDPGPEFLEQHPPKPFIPPPKIIPPPKETPVIAEKVPTKPRPKKTPPPKRKKTPPPPRPQRVPRLKSIRQDFTDYYTSNSIDYQFPNDVPFIKQEVPEDETNAFLNQLSTQPATVELLFGVENENDMPQSLDKNVASSNGQTSSVIGLNTGHSVMTSASETIVPEVTPTEVLPVDLNLVKAEVQEESHSMEVDSLPSVRILPMSVTSISRSETAFASESITETSKDSTLVNTASVMASTYAPVVTSVIASTYVSVAATSVMASTYATESGVPVVSDILSAKDSSVSSCPTSAITQKTIQHAIPSSAGDFLRQTTHGPSNSNMTYDLSGVARQGQAQRPLVYCTKDNNIVTFDGRIKS